MPNADLSLPETDPLGHGSGATLFWCRLAHGEGRRGEGAGEFGAWFPPD